LNGALLFDRYGDLGVLTYRDVEAPRPDRGEVVVRYVAAGVNPIDYKLVRGDLSEYLPLSLPTAPGVEAAGVVVAVGTGVARFALGDQVIRHGRPGTFRTEEAVDASPDADSLTPMPSGFSFEQAAVLPVAAGTAYSALLQVCAAPGDQMLVHGASGGVGLAVVQLARLLGVTNIIGTTSPQRRDIVAAAGAEPITYGDGLETALAARLVDVSVDCAGGEQSTRLAAVVERRVTIVSDPYARERGIPLVEHITAELRATLKLIGDREFRLPITGRFRLVDGVAALTRLRDGSVGGKLILVA